MIVSYQVGSSTTVRPLQTGGTYVRPPSGGGIFSPLNKIKETNKINKFKDTKEIKEMKEIEDGRGIKETMEVTGEIGASSIGLSTNSVDNLVDYSALFSSRMRELDVTVEKALVSCYRGMSPNIAHRILHTAGVDGNVMVRTVSEEHMQGIYKYFTAWASLFESDVDTVKPQSGISSSSSLLRVEPKIVSSPGKKAGATEFCPIEFVVGGDEEVRAQGERQEIDADMSPSSSSSSNDGSFGSSLTISKFLLTFYSQYEKEAEHHLLHSACDKKVSTPVMHNDV